jgi:diguanylate cyclase (GGDEF)-like protein/PAS domain S-box-containing protein
MGMTLESLSLLLDAVSDRMIVLSAPDLRILHANGSFLSVTGQSLEAVRGRPCRDVTVRPDGLCNGDCPAKQAIEAVAPSTVRYRHKNDDTGETDDEVTAFPVRDGAGGIPFVAVAFRGAGERQRLADNLRKKTEFLENIMHTCPEGIIGNDSGGNIFLFNSSAERIFGYSRADVIGKMNVASLYPGHRAREVKESLYAEEYGGRGRLIDFETEVVDRKGKRIPIRLCCTLLHDKGKDVGIIGFFTDISLRKTLEGRLVEAQERFKGIVETAKDGIISFDDDGAIVMVNRAAENVLGYDRGGMIGMDVSRIFPARHADRWREIRTAASATGAEGRSIELHALRRTGTEIPVQMSLSEKTVRGKKSFTAIVRDISNQKALEEELRLLSVTDSLTRLFNRRHFHYLAGKEAERAERTGRTFAVLMIDVDRFKLYNDSYGHAEGDLVLVSLADVIRRNIRSMDSAFRLGGEEFAVLLPETSASGAAAAAERLRAHFSEEVFQPVRENPPVGMTVSVGVAEHRKGSSLDDLIRRADLAMYAAKNGGRNRIVRHDRIDSGPPLPGPA